MIRSHGKLAMVVDDEPLILMILEEMLEDIGYRVLGFSKPADVLSDVAAGTHPDVLITDQSLVEMKGVELAARVIELVGKVPVLIVTGYGHDLACPFPIVSKPFSPAELSDALSKLGLPPAQLEC